MLRTNHVPHSDQLPTSFRYSLKAALMECRWKNRDHHQSRAAPMLNEVATKRLLLNGVAKPLITWAWGSDVVDELGYEAMTHVDWRMLRRYPVHQSARWIGCSIPQASTHTQCFCYKGLLLIFILFSYLKSVSSFFAAFVRTARHQGCD